MIRPIELTLSPSPPTSPIYEFNDTSPTTSPKYAFNDTSPTNFGTQDDDFRRIPRVATVHQKSIKPRVSTVHQKSIKPRVATVHKQTIKPRDITDYIHKYMLVTEDVLYRRFNIPNLRHFLRYEPLRYSVHSDDTCVWEFYSNTSLRDDILHYIRRQSISHIQLQRKTHCARPRFNSMMMRLSKHENLIRKFGNKWHMNSRKR